MTTGTDPLALIDMDGTLADYDASMKRELEKLRAPGEPEFPYTAHEGNPPWLEARRGLIARQPGFWRNLSPIPGGFQVVEVMEDIGFQIHILTKAPSNKPAAWMEKVEWCRQYLPSAAITVTEDKTNYYGRVLFDDWPPYYMGWLRHRKRGLVIVPAQPWNEGKTDHPNIIRWDGQNIDRIRAALVTVRDRADKEPLQLP